MLFTFYRTAAAAAAAAAVLVHRIDCRCVFVGTRARNRIGISEKQTLRDLNNIINIVLYLV